MEQKVGRNDPCPCGSGKKYKACCFKQQLPGKKKFSATVLKTAPLPPTDLMERTFGDAISRTLHAPEATPEEHLHETIPEEESP